jgi:hypothetical protein
LAAIPLSGVGHPSGTSLLIGDVAFWREERRLRTYVKEKDSASLKPQAREHQTTKLASWQSEAMQSQRLLQKREINRTLNSQ